MCLCGAPDCAECGPAQGYERQDSEPEFNPEETGYLGDDDVEL